MQLAGADAVFARRCLRVAVEKSPQSVEGYAAGEFA
jgi:hypothetical protein